MGTSVGYRIGRGGHTGGLSPPDVLEGGQQRVKKEGMGNTVVRRVAQTFPVGRLAHGWTTKECVLPAWSQGGLIEGACYRTNEGACYQRAVQTAVIMPVYETFMEL
jgi:hypothetical protein